MRYFTNKFAARHKNILMFCSKFRIHNLITSEIAAKLPSETIFIDARPSASYLQGHIAKSVNIHEFFTYLAESSNEGLGKLQTTFTDLLQKSGVTGKENIVFYEDNLGSLKGVSCRGYYLLKLFGYDDKKIFILQDGFDGWKKSNPQLVEAGECKPKSKGSFTPKINEEMHIRCDEIPQLPKDTVLIDVRDLEEWKGDSSSPYGPNFTPRKGRIQGAKHILWTDFMVDGQKFKSEKEIEKMCQDIGIKNKDQNIVVYCFKGCRSSNALVALKYAGYKNVKNYLGSWNEWSRKLDLPIDDKKL